MLAVIHALKNVLPDHHVLICSDNTLVVNYINHQGDLTLCPLGAPNSSVVPQENAVT